MLIYASIGYGESTNNEGNFGFSQIPGTAPMLPDNNTFVGFSLINADLLKNSGQLEYYIS
jgi:hypothetical protein